MDWLAQSFDTYTADPGPQLPRMQLLEPWQEATEEIAFYSKLK